MIFHAAIHGVDLHKAMKKRQRPSHEDNSQMLFKDPKEYEKMNPEEREALSKQMFDHWKTWAESNPIPSKG